MRRFGHRLVAATAVLVVGLWAFAAIAAQAQTDERRVLVFSKTAAFRHGSIPAGVRRSRNSGRRTASPSTRPRTPARSRRRTSRGTTRWSACPRPVTCSTRRSRRRSRTTSKRGGGYAGVHAASDTEYTWNWYGSLVGAYFTQPSREPERRRSRSQTTPTRRPSTCRIAGPAARSGTTSTQPARQRARAGDADERRTTPAAPRWARTTRSPGAATPGRPVWATAMGHAIASYSETNFRNHVLGGVKWAAGKRGRRLRRHRLGQLREAQPWTTTPSTRWRWPSRRTGGCSTSSGAGQVKIFKPARTSTVTAGTLSVYTGGEDGLLGMALDPNFATNGCVYLYHSPPSARPTSTGSPASPSPATRSTCVQRRSSSDVPALPGPDVAGHRRRLLQFGPRRQPVHRHRRRHPAEPRPPGRATRRWTGGPASPTWTPPAPPATPTTCAASCCASTRQRRQLHHPDRQPVRAGHGADPAGDLRDGLPQPVPLRGRPADRLGLHGRLRTGPQPADHQPRPRGAGRAQRDQAGRATTAGRSATATTSRTRRTTRTPASSARSSTATRRSTTRPTTPA